MMRSLRARLMWGTGTAAALILLAAMGAGYALVREALVDEFNDSLLTQAHSIAAMTEVRDGRIFIDAEPGELPEFLRHERPEYYQLLDSNGRTLARSPALPANQSINRNGSQRATGHAVLPDGRLGRFATYRFQLKTDEEDGLPANPSITVIVARDMADLAHTLDRIGSLFLLAATLATVTIVLITVLIIRRALRPMQRLSQQIGAINTHNLSTRLDGRDLPAELAPIVARLNEVLERLQDAFERERNFTADAAHELRTPLAGLEAALEVCASRRREPQAYQRVVTDCLRVARSMHGMVDDLLLLARADAGHVPLNHEPVATDQLIHGSWQSFIELANARSLQIDFDTPPLQVDTDPDRLGHVLSHLFDNAVRHADDAGTIRVITRLITRPAGDTVSICIINSGSKVSAEDVDKVFERFWRADQARTATESHSGLGLAVCQKLVQALHGSIKIDSIAGGDFLVELRFPRSSGSQPITPKLIATV